MTGNRRPSPFQMTLDSLLARHPDARRIAFTRTGEPIALLLGGGGHTPESPVVAIARRRAA